jgi:hypothetical protein
MCIIIYCQINEFSSNQINWVLSRRSSLQFPFFNFFWQFLWALFFSTTTIPKQLPKITIYDGPHKLGAIYLTNGGVIIFNCIIDDHPPTTNARSYSHQQITQSFLQVSNSYLLAGKSSIGMQFNFVFVADGHKNHGKPTLNLQSREYLDFLFQTLKKTHRNLFIYNPKANEHYCIVVQMIPIYIRPPKALNGSKKGIE